MVRCIRGWHCVLSDGHVVFVRFASRLSDEFGTFIYRIGPSPDDAVCRTVWCYDDKGVPWTCASCGVPIDRESRADLPRRLN